MRAIPAIVESVAAPAIAQVRSIFSSLREADAQVEKADKRFEDAERTRSKYRETQARLRLELGRALIEVRKQWPKRGPNARGWGEFLEREGIADRNARNWMSLAGYVESVSESHTDDSETPQGRVPTQREVLSARKRDSDEIAPRWDPDEVIPSNTNERPDSAPVADTEEPSRTSGRGKPQWLMRSLVRDYTRNGDLVCDPLAGYGSTLLAAVSEKRRAIGSEIDPEIVTASGIGELRVGDWRLALVDAGDVDAVITDPPYSARTHAAKTTRSDGSSADGLTPTYGAWTPDDVHEFVKHWSPRCRGWMVALTDSELLAAWRDAYRSAGRYAFAPVPIVIKGMSVRISGDGPSSWCIYAMVARPRELSKWGTLPGAYVGTKERELWEVSNGG
jgi:hypothetical protein